jgi:hypothetical protein
VLRLRAFGSLGLLTLCLVRPALAQEDAKAAAVAAFDDGRKLIEKKRIDEACQKFGESQKLDPQLGTLLHWADCLERNGQTASAWARFRDASELAAARKDRRQSLAESRAANLFPRLSKLQIDVDQGNDAVELRIQRNGIEVGRTLWGTPTPTDPGTHSLEVTAPGRKPWTKSVVVPTGGSTTAVHVPVLEPAESTQVPTKEAPAPSDAASTPEGAPSDSWISRRWPVLLATGVGLAGVGIGSVFGLQSKKSGDDADRYCDGEKCFDQRGVTLKADAIKQGNISTIAFAAGGVGLATAGVLLLVLPGKPEGGTQTGIVLAPNGVSLRGQF